MDSRESLTSLSLLHKAEKKKQLRNFERKKLAGAANRAASARILSQKRR
jgi:hypothetical protein